MIAAAVAAHYCTPRDFGRACLHAVAPLIFAFLWDLELGFYGLDWGQLVESTTAMIETVETKTTTALLLL